MLLRGVDKIDFFWLIYVYMFCYFYDSFIMIIGVVSFDVILVSERFYWNGILFVVVMRVVLFVKKYLKCDLIVVDLFVGRGMIVKVCFDMNVLVIGIDIDLK